MIRIKSIITPRGFLIAVLFGLLAYFSIQSKLYFNIPGTNLITDPREIFTLLGAAFSGPVGGIIVGILSSLYDPTTGLIYYVTAQHVFGAAVVGYVYKKTKNDDLNIIYLLFLWNIIVFCYYFILYIPGYFITYYFFPDTYSIITGEINQPISALLNILYGWRAEYLFTAVISSLVLAALPRRLRNPLWGNNLIKPFPAFKKSSKLFTTELFQHNISFRMSLWFLLFLLLPIMLIAVFVNVIIKESVLKTEAEQLIHAASNGIILSDIMKDVPRQHYHQIDYNQQKYLILLNRSEEENLFIRSPLFISRYLSQIHKRINTERQGTIIDVQNSTALGFMHSRDRFTSIAYSGPDKLNELLKGMEWLSGKNLLIALFGISILGGFIIYYIIGMPLKKLRVAAEQVSKGIYSTQVDLSGMEDDVAQLGKTFNMMIGSINTAKQNLLDAQENRLKVEREKNKFAAELRRISDNIDDIIVKTSITGEILSINPAAFKTLGYEVNEMIGHNFDSIVYDEDKALAALHFDKLFSLKESIKFQLRFTRKSGELIFMDAVGNPLPDEDGSTSGFIFALRDITLLKEIEDNLRKAKEEAEKTSRLKTDFLAQMSHEIRTPVNSILSFSSLIREEVYDKVDSNLQFGFHAIENSSKRLIATIESILNFSQLMRKNYDLKLASVDISQVVSGVIHEFTLAATKKNLTLSHANYCNGCCLITDKYILMQITANLVDNAIKYTDKGTVEVLTLNNDESVELIVKDTGKGISADYLKRIFEPFSQEESGYERKFEGNGLGLAIVKEYCSLINAQISVKSTPGKGTEFKVIFGCIR